MNAEETHPFDANTEDRHPVDLLAEEFAARLRAGENPLIEEYVAKHPEHAQLIRSVFPSIALVERVSDRAAQQAKSSHPSSLGLLPKHMPESLGDFRLIREIGRGGMGVVYEAIQLSLKRHVALKVVGTIPSGSEKQLARFRREAEAAASLHHTNIVPVYGIGEDQGVQYYAMQLIDGVTLSQVVHSLQGSEFARPRPPAHEASHATFSTEAAIHLLLRNDSLLEPKLHSETKSVEETTNLFSNPHPSSPESREAIAFLPKLSQAYFRNVAKLVSHVADALQYAHHQGVLHRDIKPGNLLLDRDGIVWITDFGLARCNDVEGMTLTGEIVGTLRYMAPEQMTGHADSRTDIYSLGLTLYELLTLRPAIEQPQSRMYQTNPHEAVSRMRSLNPDIPFDLQTITLKACAQDPSHRYQTAADLEEDLRRFLEDRPILARRATPVERLYRWARRNPAIACLSSATLLLLVTIASLLAIYNQRKQLALNAISQERDRANANLREKTEALAAVEKERTRAELNLDLAVQAFDTVIANIAGRGGSLAVLSDLDVAGEVASLADATLSDADVVLLETLLGFFDRFSAENAKDLSRKSADARRRVGDIQHRLGRLDDAEQSYRTALEAYQLKAADHPDHAELVIAEAEILNELLVIAAKRGQMQSAFQFYEQARSLLEQSPSLRRSTEGRFVLAKTHNNLAAIGFRYGRGPSQRPRPAMMNRPAKPFDESLNPLQKERLQRETQANGEALQLLHDLTEESPDVAAYQVAYAQALCDEFRIARILNDWKRADDSLAKAIRIQEELIRRYPDSDAFKFELASTLSLIGPSKPNEVPRFMRSMKLSDELIAKHPNVAEYRALSAQTLHRLAMLQWTANRRDRAEESLQQAVAVQQKLVDQYPDVLLYQMNWLQSILSMAELHFETNRRELAQQDLAAALAQLEKLQGQNRLAGALQPMMARLREAQKRYE